MGLFDFRHTEENYEKSLAQYGPGPKALLWWDYRSMAVRFRELIKDVPIESYSILDAGCGMGDLLPFLYAKSDNFKYLGVDINSEFIKIARRRYEGHEFKVGDPFNKTIGQFDLVLSSGVMNGNVKNWHNKRKRMITNLFEQADKALAFNMAGGARADSSDPLIAYADIQEIYKFCKTLSPRVILNDKYLHNDFTITMFKRGRSA